MHTIDLGIVLSASPENLPCPAIVSVTRVLLEKNKWALHANNVVRVDLVRVKPILDALTAPKVFTKSKQEHRTVCHVCPANFKSSRVNRLVTRARRKHLAKVPMLLDVHHVILAKNRSRAVRNVLNALLVKPVLG